MLRFVYTAPDGTRTIDPTDRVLASLLFDTAWSDWDSSPNAESCLEPIVDTGSPVRNDGIRQFNISRDQPCLIIKQPDPGRFFVTYMERAAQYVPYNGSSLTPYTLSHSGGDPFRIPLACTTDVDATQRIVAAFYNDLSRDTSLNWLDWCDLDLPDDWY